MNFDNSVRKADNFAGDGGFPTQKSGIFGSGGVSTRIPVKPFLSEEM